MKHELKIWPQFYRPVAEGKNTFEVRENDRAFQAGDTVVLREWNPEIESTREVYEPFLIKTGQSKTRFQMGDYTESKPLTFKIGYVLPIDDKRVVFSLLTELDRKAE